MNSSETSQQNPSDMRLNLKNWKQSTASNAYLFIDDGCIPKGTQSRGNFSAQIC